MNICSECGQHLAAGTEKYRPNCGQDLMKGEVRGESGSWTVNVNLQELASIQDPEYAKALKDFSENKSLDELAKEVQGVKPGREEQIDIPYS